MADKKNEASKGSAPPSDQIPYDPNQMVRLFSEIGAVKVEADSERAFVDVQSIQTGANGGEKPAPAAIRGEVNTCQETLRQIVLEMYARSGEDETMAAGGFHHVLGGSSVGFDESGESEQTPQSEPVLSVPIGEEGHPTASVLGLGDQLESFQERLAETLSDLEIDIEYRRVEDGAKATIKTRRGSEEGTISTVESPADDEGKPTDVADDEGSDTAEPSVREIVRRTVDGGAITLKITAPGTGLATADGDTGAAVTNSSLAQNNKRQTAIFANDFGNIQLAVNLVVNANFIFGLESD